MREITTSESETVAGGLQFAGFGYGRIPGFYNEDFSRSGPYGATFDHSFGNGWSLSAGFARGGDRGLEVRYTW